GLGGGGAILRRHEGERFWHVQAHAWANRQRAGCIQSAAESSAQWRAQQAREFEAGTGAGTAAPAERRHHRDDHDVYGLAATLGARIFCRSSAQEARAEA